MLASQTTLAVNSVQFKLTKYFRAAFQNKLPTTKTVHKTFCQRRNFNPNNNAFTAVLPYSPIDPQIDSPRVRTTTQVCGTSFITLTTLCYLRVRLVNCCCKLENVFSSLFFRGELHPKCCITAFFWVENKIQFSYPIEQ